MLYLLRDITCNRKAHAQVRHRPLDRLCPRLHSGPRPTLVTAQIAHARQLIEAEGKPVAEVARLLGVHRATLYRALEAHQ
jgi:DNA invertase Pin-like site-specific DNA recombinase